MADPGTAAAESGLRGGLEVRDRAVSRIAEQASLQVTGTTQQEGAMDRLRRRDYPRAEVDVRRSVAWIKLNVAASWPCQVEDLAGRVQETVIAETTRLSGLDIRSADVRLHLIPPAGNDQSGRRVE